MEEALYHLTRPWRGEYDPPVRGYWGITTIIMPVLASASQAQASAWNPDPWSGEIISGYVQSTATEAVDDFGDPVLLDAFSKRISQNYATLGLTKRIAIVGALDWQRSQIIGPGVDVSFSKPSTVSAGLQYQVSRREGHATALSVSYLDGIDLPIQLLTVEGREPSVEVRGLWGESRTVLERNVFAELQLAGRYRLSGEFGGMQSQLTLGGDLSERIMLISKLRYHQEEPGIYERLAIARQTRWEIEASGVYRWRDRDWFELGYVGTLSGRNAVMERGVKVGYWRKF